MKSRLALFASAVALACLLNADTPATDARSTGETALKDRDWPKAIASLTEALASATSGKDEILFLLATAQHHNRDYDAAIASLDRIAREHAGSPFSSKALFRKGDALAAKREFALAAQIYDLQVAALTAPERRKKIAMVYVEAGREFLNPKDPKDPTFVANFVAARNLLVKSLELEALGAEEEGVRVDIVTCELKSNWNVAETLKTCDAFLEKFPQSARRDEALFARGSALRGLGRAWEAKKTWLRIPAELPASARAGEALYSAALLHVTEQGATADLEELRRALPLLRRVAKEYPATEWGPKAAWLSGVALAQYEELRDDARAELTAFVNAQPKDERAPEALLRVAWLHAADFDDAKAIATLEDFLKRFPDSPRWPEVRQQIAEVRFAGAQRAFVRKDWAAARQAALDFTVLHPTDHRTAMMAFRGGETFKEEKKFKEAVESWLKVATRFPGNDEGHHARFSAAELMAAELGDFETAMKELGKVSGRWGGEAQKLLRKLQQPSLALRTDRVFHGAESATVKLTVRNLENVKLRFWSLDLKDYFEKKATTAGLESLEVSIIAPDKEWEYPVKEYRRFKELTFDVELPKKDPGAYIVAASAGTLEATTVVVVSDLAMIARAGRRGATVLVENMRTGERVENALIRTAADGKHLKAWAPDAAAGTLSFLAESNGHLAFRDMTVGALPIPIERAPKALLILDRQICEPGDEVQVSIIVRDAADGAWGVPRDKKYRLAATSPQGVVFHETELALSASGVAVAKFRTMPMLPGQIRLDVFEMSRPQEKHLGRATMTAVDSVQPTNSFEFLVDDRAYFAGEDIPVTGVLRDAHGRPMPGRKVSVWTGEMEPSEVLTAADGTFPILLKDTDRFYRDGWARFGAQFEGLGDNHAVAVLPRTVRISFEDGSRLTEPLFAGDPKSISIKTLKADDTPAPGSFKWTVTRTTPAGERLPVASGDLATDKDGLGKFTFTAKEGGIHTLTVSTRDSDGIPSRSQTAVQVLDDKDERKLRLASSSDDFEAGKPMEFTIVSRLDRGLAFVTLEGEKVEQVVSLVAEKGKTTVKLNAPPAGTRDFTISVMMMQGNAFHADVRDFRVKQPEVRVVPEKKEYRPGEEATVKVTAQPGSEVVFVAGEGTIAHLDVGAFLPVRPGVHFTGDSSASTSFAWQTREIDPVLLEALAQLDELQSNKKSRVMMEKDAAKMKGDFESDHNEDAEDMIGTGGGAGGKYGGRLGGRRNLVARGGGTQGSRRGGEPAPLLFAVAKADASGVATFKFRMPQGWSDVTAAAWSIDAGNQIAAARETVKGRAAVTIDVHAPASALEGEKTSVAALLTNTSTTPQEVTLNFAGGDVKISMPPRSTVEKIFDWTAAPGFAISLDGVRQDVAVPLRTAPSAFAEIGGSFTASAEIKVEGTGTLHVRVATGPATLLESLAEGSDPLTPASDAAARLIALVARHRLSSFAGAPAAVRLFAAFRASNIRDSADQDVAGDVLMYLAAAEAKSADLDIEPDPSRLKSRFPQAASDDAKAWILFALSRGSQAEYGYVHRLWRNIDALPPRALACLALAMKAAGKADEASTAVDRLVKAIKEDHWEASALPAPDSSNTHFSTTALASFALAEIDPANPLLAKSRAWLLSRRPQGAAERALLALAMQSNADKSEVTELVVDGQSVKGFGEVVATKGVVEPKGAGTFYVTAWRATGTAPEPAVKVAVKRRAEWPTLVVEGVSVPSVPVSVKEPVENPSMAKVAAGNTFMLRFDLTVTGPFTQYVRFNLPEVTGLHVEPEHLRLLLPPQAEAERTYTFQFPAYADLIGTSPDLQVLAPGTAYREGWQITHGERLGAGRVLYEKKQWKAVRDTLLPLFEKGSLHDAASIDAARMLAYSAVELGEHETVVRYFEILKEKAPGEVVPFDRIRAVGKAYAAMNEHERAMQVYSGTCDAYFLQEANVAGALEDLGRWRDATEWMKKLLSEQPDTALNREMVFGLGQRLYVRAKSQRDPAEKNPKMLTREELLAESSAAFERHLSWFPTDPEGDRVMLSLGSAYLEAGSYDLAELSARAAAKRYPKSQYQDTFDYTQAFAYFAQKKFAEALVLCDRLETFDYGAKANPGPAVIRTQAVLMKAQIFHAKGELDKALENYKKVKEKSADAQRSIAFLEREALAVQDITIAPLSKAAELELEYAGVAEAHVRAYKVDLTMLALRRRNLADASTIEVAGIRPVFEKKLTLDHPNARRRERQRFTLDLKEPGAYLVGVKAGDFFASGLVLRTNLSMSVQEEQGGTVRVNVSDVAGGGFAEGVKVTIFGTDDQKIASDKTDLRGIWETHNVVGLAVVVAEKDGHFAVFRGKNALGALPAAQTRPAMDKMLKEQQQELLDAEINKANDMMEENYGRNVRKQQGGVEVERTKK